MDKINREAYNYLVGIETDLDKLLQSLNGWLCNQEMETTELQETNFYFYMEIKNNYVKDVIFELTLDGDETIKIGTDVIHNNIEQLILERQKDAEENKDQEDHLDRTFGW